MRRESKWDRSLLVPVSLQEVYVATGEYTAKIMIDPEVSPEIEDVKVTVCNADGSPFDYSYRRWGTKLNLRFVIDEKTPDGVGTIDVQMVGKNRKVSKRFCFWVFK